MALSECYVDPSLASSSGTGTIGDPYGDLQYAFDTETYNTIEGNIFHLKAGTAEVLSSPISFTTFGTPSSSAPVILRGYTSVANDGGVGEINLNGNTYTNSIIRGCGFYDIKFTTGPSSTAMLTLSTECTVFSCEFNTGNNIGITSTGNYNSILGSYFYNLGGTAAINATGNGTKIHGNYIKQGPTYTMTQAINVAGGGIDVSHNIISVDGSSKGINLAFYGGMVKNNTILSSSGTGVGINLGTTAVVPGTSIINNYVEGFSGTGGKGIYTIAELSGPIIRGFNACYNNSTNFDTNYNHAGVDLGSDETLSVTGLAKSGSETFANRFTYFEPVDTGGMYSGYLYGAKGAVLAPSGGTSGGLLRHPGMFGGMLG